MHSLPPHSSEVDGFTIDIELSPDNIAGGPDGHGGHLFEDGFICIRAVNLGANPTFPEVKELTVVVAKLSRVDV